MPRVNKHIEGIYNGNIGSYDSAKAKKLTTKINYGPDGLPWEYWLSDAKYNVYVHTVNKVYSMQDKSKVMLCTPEEYKFLHDVIHKLLLNREYSDSNTDAGKHEVLSRIYLLKQKFIEADKEDVKRDTQNELKLICGSKIPRTEDLLAEMRKISNTINSMLSPRNKYLELMLPILRYYQIPEDDRLNYCRLAFNALKAKGNKNVPTARPHVFCYTAWRNLFKELSIFPEDDEQEIKDVEKDKIDPVYCIMHALIHQEIKYPLPHYPREDVRLLYNRIKLYYRKIKS